MTCLSPLRQLPVRVLVVKLSSMGDIIHATGCLRALREALPKSHISLAVEDRWASAVRHDPHIDSLVRSSASSTLTLRYALEVRRLVASHGPFDVALDLQGNRRSAAWVYLSGAQTRLGRGTFRPGWKIALQPDLTQHAVTVCADICTAAGIPVGDPSPRLYTGPHEEDSLDDVLRRRGMPGSGFVILNPFSRWRSKSVPLETMAAVITQLPRDIRESVVISGGPEDARDAARLCAMLPVCPVHSLAAELSLDQALCLYRRARLMVSCDSGPMHAAAALGVPVVALFGPTHPERTGPWGPGHTVIQALRPVSHHAYRLDAECAHMQRLEPNAIAQAVLSHLRDGRS